MKKLTKIKVSNILGGTFYDRLMKQDMKCTMSMNHGGSGGRACRRLARMASRMDC
jgi:hypothetical protein